MAIEKVTIPKNAKRIALRPVALGEATGHHHSFICEGGAAVLEQCVEMYEGKDGLTYIRINDLAEEIGGVRLEHQEHKSHAVPPGEYCVTIQSEETDWGQRPVVD
jgi:hypothetical protein